MKSFLAILVLTTALGVGYWKTQNPEGDVNDARQQANVLLQRLRSGIDAVREHKTATVASVTTAPTMVADSLPTLSEQLRTIQSSSTQRLAELQSLQTTSTERLVKLQEITETGNARIADLEARLDNGLGDAGDRLLNIERQLKSLATGTASPIALNLDETLNSLRSEMDNKLQTALAALQRENPVQTSDLEPLLSRLDAQDRLLAEHGVQVQEATQRAAKSDEQFTAKSEEIVALKQEYEAQVRRVDELLARLDAQDRRLAEQGELVQNVTQQAATSDEQIAEKTRELVALRQQNEVQLQRFNELLERLETQDRLLAEQGERVQEATQKADRATLDSNQKHTESVQQIVALRLESQAQTRRFDEILARLDAQDRLLATQNDRVVLAQRQAENASEKSQALSSRLDTLASAATLADSDTQSTGFDPVATQIDARLATMEERLAAATNVDTRATIENLNRQLNTAAERVGALETRLASVPGAELQASVEQRFNELDRQLTSLDRSAADATIEDLKRQLNAATARVGTLESRLATLPGAELETSIEQRFNELDQKVATLDRSTTDATVDDLKQQLSGATARIGELESRLAVVPGAELQASIDERFSELDLKMATIDRSVVDLGTGMGNLQSRVGELQTSLGSTSIDELQQQLEQQLTNLEKQIRESPVTTDLQSLTTALDQSRARIQSLEQLVNNLPASTLAESAKEAQDALQQQIAALEARLAESAAEAPKALVSTLTEVQKKVTELENREYLTAADLPRLSENRSVQYKIYFDKGEVEITADAAKVLDSFLAQESKRATAVSIFGTTDRSGSYDFNQQLALRRANRVRSYLIQRGFEFTRIRDVDGIGEDLAISTTGDGKEDPNQRSVILIAFQP